LGVHVCEGGGSARDMHHVRDRVRATLRATIDAGRPATKGARLPQIGPLEILVIFIVALVVFGPSKLPQIGRQVGRGVREFRKFQAGLRDDIEDAFREEDDELDDGRDGHDESDEPKRLEAGTPDPDKPDPGTPDPGKPDPGKPTELPSTDTTA
jgi:sec-independent protein translocase protein TatA